VLLAVIAVLEKLGQQPALAVAVVRQQPQLPLLLLQFLHATVVAGQQHVCEALLPVLVMFSSHITTLLLQQLPHHQGSRTAGHDAAAAAEGSGSSRQVAADISLQLLICIAEVLQNCSSENLDAMDAGWYLTALTSKELVQEIQQHQQQQILQDQQCGDRQQLQHYGCWPDQLPQLCSHLCRAMIPSTSQGYALQSSHYVISCICFMHNWLMTDQTCRVGSPGTASYSTQAADEHDRMYFTLVSIIPCVQRLAQHVLQQQQQQGGEAYSGYAAAAALLQESLDSLSQLIK
jgi:hypothetical protein